MFWPLLGCSIILFYFVLQIFTVATSLKDANPTERTEILDAWEDSRLMFRPIINLFRK